MSSSASLLARTLVLVVPLALSVAAASFGGCSDLVNAGADSGLQTSSEDANPISTIDAPVINVGVDSSFDAGVDANDGGVQCSVENASLGSPTDLVCTGLYADFETKTIASNVAAYDPGLHMWADGASVARYILLPAGQTIDTGDMNEWQFPVGTKAWQEFQIAGTRVETRWYWKRGNADWVRGSYAWSGDGTSSAVYTPQGATNVGGSSYSIPAVGDCDTCHLGREDQLLGFEAVSLAQPSATGMNLAALEKAGLLSQAPSGSLQIPDDGTGFAAPALGWLHANCGTSCHSASPSANAAESGLFLRLEIGTGDAGPLLGDVPSTNTYVTSVNVPAQTSPFGAEGWHRITPNDPFDGGLGTSLIPFAAAARGVAGVQMPPLATATADLADVDAVRAWITNGHFP